MILKNKLALFISVFAIFLFVSAKSADAAIISVIPDKRILKIGEETNVDVRIDTSDASINAAQATIQFPNTILEVTKIDKTNSVFSFWIDEPSFSNEGGVVKFIGGTPKGVAGKSLQVLKFTVKAKNLGSAEITLSDAAVTASDGQGSNVLSKMEGAIILVSDGTILPPPPTPPPAASTEPKTVVVPPAQPQKIERKAIPSKKLPIIPVIKVPFYPDQTKWYSHVGEAIALWEVPDDVIKVAVKLDQSPNTTPMVEEKELVNGKNLGVIQEGIWYAHAQFKNNIGWGPTAHYKISLDTTVPLSFEVSIDNAASENPSPQISFSAADALSGFSHAIILVDGQEVKETTETLAVLPPSGPGLHTVLARVFDRAGNYVEDDLKFEILPLPTPMIDFISRSVSKGEPLFVAGKSISNALINVRIASAAGQEFLKDTAQSDNSGNWKIEIDKVLPIGKYVLVAVAQDERGAMSYPSEAETFKVRSKIVFSLGKFIDLGWLEIFLITLLIIVAGAGLFFWRYVAGQKTREAYRIIVKRDIEKISNLLLESVEELTDAQIARDTGRKIDSAKINSLLDGMKGTIEKLKKYIGQEVNKLK